MTTHRNRSLLTAGGILKLLKNWWSRAKPILATVPRTNWMTCGKKRAAEGRGNYYDRRWRNRDPADAPDSAKPVIRIKAPLDGQSTIEDEVQGQVTIDNANLDDFIILRSDGTPTYMLAVVVDDHDMDITHVIRGDDHLNNTFRQNVIYDAMGWDKPVYAHLPLIHGPDGAKFSKRHGAQSVEEYREMGYLPEALRNYLLRLGWGHGDEEIIPTDRAIELFDLPGVNKAAAKFDHAKLESLNAHYINEADNERLIDLTAPFLKTRHGLEIDNTGRGRLRAGMDELKDRAKTLLQLADEAAFYLKSIPLSYDDKAVKNLQGAQDMLLTLTGRFKALPNFKAEAIETACRDLAKELYGGKLGKVMMPLRAALTGTDKSPSLFHAAEILGLDETCGRMQAAADYAAKQ